MITFNLAHLLMGCSVVFMIGAKAATRENIKNARLYAERINRYEREQAALRSNSPEI